ncbi:FadR/GntR family transcriptional regulator [Gulosibacter bifidus]|uniref:FadR/GntR family transcriptional regulator n=1 Tax=Gulosibacter bifidus TaxID=272239 RepID=A0ABW5RHG7_9MICO|nr:GntR family transcriptional regulator [Gulosibacter bifidus]
MDVANRALQPSHPATEPITLAPASGALGASVFASLPPFDRAEAIASRLRSSIRVGLLQEGTRLPSEYEMAESFSVSPATLRDALATLREEGLVETRRGRNGGTFVVAVPETARSVLIQHLSSYSVVDLRDLGDTHIALATASARLAADRAVSTDISRLRQLVKVFRTAADAADRARADSRFWLELAVVAQSKRILALEIELQLEFAGLLWAPFHRERSHTEAASQMTQLVDALEQPDAERAVAITSARLRADTYYLIDTKLTLSINDDQEG